ncbi:hypothetical protein FRC17_001749 [Serendipita sp. 399]|nr:hypothetical protein FRC17_001749 [Serendipita sp. 399]
MCGWPQFEFGEKMGENGRYTIVRKLGWGMHSSTWLARDDVDKRYVAVKALTGHITELVWRYYVFEEQILEMLSKPPASPHCVPLLDKFTLPGLGSAGNHICFVMPVYRGDVRKLMGADQSESLPLPLVKRILLHILRGLAHTHSHGVVHTDLKSDQFFIKHDLTTEEIDRCVEDDPPRRHPPEMSEDGVVHVAVSQPLPMVSMEEAMRATYVLGDFGCAFEVKFKPTYTITSPALRPPEVYLGGQWGTEADIWTFGCLVFELINSNPLFSYKPNPKLGLDETAHILYQMIVFSGQDFSRELLNDFPLADQYFDSECNLKGNPKIPNTIIEHAFQQFKKIPRVDISKTAFFMRRCLSLYPETRAKAEELLDDPWFEGVE